MGINNETYQWLTKKNLLDFSTFKNAIIIGEQQFSDIPDGDIKHLSLFKDYLRKNGWSAEAIDLGDHPVYASSLKLDLANPLPEDMFGKFDILFDFGTGEHIRDQIEYWQNCHKLVKENGTRIHVLPPPNTWPGHCKYRYTEKFFNILCESFGYSIDEITTIKRNQKFDLVFAAFNNGNQSFVKDKFSSYVLPEIDVLDNFVDNESL